MKIKWITNLITARIFGVVFLILGLLAILLEQPFSQARAVAITAVSYVFWGLYFSTTISSEEIVKVRGWLFPHFRTKYALLKRIELRSDYVYQQGAGAHSHHALYIGVINGPFNDYIDVSGGVKDPNKGQSLIEYVKTLSALTDLPVIIDDEFKQHFLLKFGFEFSY